MRDKYWPQQTWLQQYEKDFSYSSELTQQNYSCFSFFYLNKKTTHFVFYQKKKTKQLTSRMSDVGGYLY